MTTRNDMRPDTQGPEQRQPNEKPEKQWVEKEKSRNREYQSDRDARRDDDKDRRYEHGGARIPDKG